MGVRKKLVLLVLLALAPLIVLDGVNIYNEFHRREQEDLRASLELAEAIGAAFNNYLDSLWTTELALGAALLPQGSPLPTAGATELMRQQLPEHPAVVRFVWLDPASEVLASTDDRNYGVPIADRPHIQSIVAGQTNSLSDLMISRVTDEPIIVVARGIRRQGRLVAIVMAAVDVAKLDAALPVERSGSRTFGLVDRNGMMVYRNIAPDLPWDRRQIAPDSPGVGALRGEKTLSAEFRAPVDNTVRMGAAVPIPEIGWAAYASTTVAEVHALALLDVERHIAVVALAMLASGLFVFMIGRGIVRPIHSLSAAALAIAGGDLGARAELFGKDEVGAAARTFNQMADRIQESEALLRTRAEQQGAVAALGQHALAGTPLPDVMAEAVHLLAELLRVEYCTVLELLPAGDAMLMRAGTGWEEGVLGRVTVPDDASFQAGYSLHYHEPVIVEDLRTDTRFGHHKFLLAHGVVSGMTVTIHGPSGPYGVLAAHTTARRSFSRDDVHFLQAMANVLGTVAHRAQAEAARAELLAKEQAARADADTERQRLYDLIMQAPAMICIQRGPDFVYELVNPLYLRLLGGFDPTGRPLREVLPELERVGGLALMEHLYQTGERYDAAEAPFHLTAPDGTVAEGYLNVSLQPLRGADGQVEGLLSFLVDVTREVRARQAVEALAADLRTLARQQAAVAELGRLALEAAGGGLIAWLGEASRTVADTLEVEVCSILELLPDLQTLLLRAGTGWPEGAIGRVRTTIDANSQAAQALRTGSPVTLSHVSDSPAVWLPPELADLGVVSALSVIIQGQKRPLGVLGVQTTRQRQFTEDDLNFLQAVAHMTATTVERGMTSRRMAAQHAISRLLAGSASVEEAAPKVLQAAGEGLWWQLGALWLVDRSTGQLACAHLWRHPDLAEPEFLALSRQLLGPTGSAVPGDRWREVQPRWAPNLAAEGDLPHQQAFLAAGMRSGVWLPISVGREVLGALSFYWHELRAPSEDTLTVLTAVASQVGQFMERIRAEAELRTLNAELEVRVAERTAELAAANMELEAFTSSASHDLRAPLRTIDGFSQALAEDCAAALDVQGQDYLRRIRVASQRMEHLIDDLLRLSRVTLTELRREAVDLSAIATGVIEDLTRARPGRSGVRFTIQSGLNAYGDGRLLRVVLENLLGNAWKFTEGQAEASITFGRTNYPGRPAYFVRDDGAGFDMAYADKLFRAFQRLHSAEEFDGSGIGLATVQRIILKHGGQVWAEGLTGHGATFYFTL